MREVRQPGGAVDERGAHRGQGEQKAEVEAVDQANHQLIEERLRGAFALAEEQVDDLRPGESEFHLLRGGVAVDDHALGQRRLVDREGVFLLFGDVQPPLSLGVGDRFGLEAVAGHFDSDVGDALLLEGDDAAEVEVRRLLVTARGVRSGRESARCGQEQHRRREERADHDDQPGLDSSNA